MRCAVLIARTVCASKCLWSASPLRLEKKKFAHKNESIVREHTPSILLLLFFYTTPLSHSRFCKRKPQGLSLFCCAGGCLCPVICRWWWVVFPDRPDTGACGLETPPISGDVLRLETTCCAVQWWYGRLGMSERTSRRLVIVAQTGVLQEGKRASACTVCMDVYNVWSGNGVLAVPKRTRKRAVCLSVYDTGPFQEQHAAMTNKEQQMGRV